MEYSKYQTNIFDWVAGGKGNAQVIAPAGSGKCLGKDTKVLMYDGSIKNVQDVIVGDLLMGDDSTPRLVRSTNVGWGDLYRINPIKGDSWVCNADHILTLSGSNHHLGKTIDIGLQEILKKHKKNQRYDRNWKLLRSEGVRYEKLPQLDFSSYLIGLWIGDGNKDSQTITTPDEEIINFLKVFSSLKGYRLHDSPNKTTNPKDKTRKITLSKGGQLDFVDNPLRNFLLNECRSSDKSEKIIPKNYLLSTYMGRLYLLAGLLDTDGYYHDGYYEIVSKYENLSEQILFLARSLGFAAYKNIKKVKLDTWKESRDYYRITISGNLSIIPCIIKRKQAKERKQIKRVNVTGWDVEYIGKGDYFGFTLDGNGRFLLGDFTVTHNTFTGVKAVSYIPKGMVKPNIVYLAFNKHIQEELALKLPDYAVAKTYHSFGLSAFQKKPQINAYKNNDILKAKFGKEKYALFPLISRITGLFKSNLQSDVTHQTVNECIDHHGLEIDENGEYDFDIIVEGVRDLLDPSHIERLGQIDFDDMIWYPVVKKLPIESVDYILVDEWQDTNAAQGELVLRAKNSHGRVIAIGDPNQAIYGWRGAGIDTMESMQKRLEAITLPLSITYRCPLAVVQLVNQTFPHIPFEAWDQAIQGSVNTIKEEQMFKQLNPGDMVLCRLNAPLVAPAMRCLREGKKAIIKGKDIGKNLIQLINKVVSKYYPQNINEFLSDLDDYCLKETMKLVETERHTLADLLRDKQETLYAFADGCESIMEMKNNIEKIFDDEVQGIIFSSVHRAKGLETDHVYILKPELLPFKRAKMEWQKRQEVNLQYVAYSRAKVSLNFVV